MSQSFFEKLAALDAVIAAGPNRCNYSADLAPHFENPEIQRYFFGKLQSPEWLESLRAAGVFRQVPDAPAAEGGIAFPLWPPGEYLKRVASSSPQLVCRIVDEIPQTTNIRVHGDIAEAMCSVPGRLAVKWVVRESEWIASQDVLYLDLPLKLGRLIERLGTDGEADTALNLARSVLGVLQDPRQQHDESSPFRDIREPHARFDLWEYEQILNKNIPRLVDAAGEQALTLLCDLLDRAILLSDRHGAERRPWDHSHIWRPAIEDHQQNLNLGVKDLLVTGVRNAAEQMARKEPESVPRIVGLLEKRGQSWLVFRRIALHLLRLLPEAALELVRARLLDRALFRSVETRHEYFLLQKECFGQLGSDDRKVILGWIDQGPPDVDQTLKAWEKFTGQPATPEDRTRYIRRWKRDRLAPLEEHLDPARKEAYAKLLSEEGRPEHPEFTSYHEGGAVGPRSPQSREELSKMPPRDLVSYLLNWKPAGDWLHAASPEGLGREITAVVSKDPATYAAGAAEFERLSEPTYIRAVIQGFQSVLKQGTKFKWRPVLGLCSWAVTRQRDIPDRKVGPLERMDPHWGWTRTAVVRLLTDGFASDTNRAPLELRERVWQAIEPVTYDPDPTPEQEEKYVKGGDEKEYRKRGMKVRSLDPLTSAINSVRGVAMEAVVQYALWVRSGFEKSGEGEALLARGFEAMPEVRRVLDRHLDTGAEPSLAVRAFYGQRFPWLQLLDRKWAEENTVRLLPRNQLEFWHAAWDTYVCHCPPYDNVFDWLKDEYAFAVEQIGAHEHEWDTPQAPDYFLAQHLMTLYWRRKLDYRDNILNAFYRRADTKLRGYALNFVGRSLRDTKEPIPGEIVERLKDLWANRLATAKLQPEASADELRQYGWWFASRKFDDGWSINQLLEALRLAGWVEPDHLVVERLAEISEAWPLQCIEALEMIVNGDTKGWAILVWGDKAKHIIRAARMSGNPDARRAAEDLVNLLGSRGHFDFGELLKEPS